MLKDVCSIYTDSTDVVDLRDSAVVSLGYAGFIRFNKIGNLLCKDVQFKTDNL